MMIAGLIMAGLKIIKVLWKYVNESPNKSA